MFSAKRFFPLSAISETIGTTSPRPRSPTPPPKVKKCIWMKVVAFESGR